MKKIYLTLSALLLITCSSILAQPYSPLPAVTYNYTGSVQTYTVPPCVYQLQVDVRGAQGDANASARSLGGLGGRIQGTLSVTPGQVLNVYVGGGGIISIVAGWNGGGPAGLSYADPAWAPSPACPSSDGGSGGDGSDIRVAPYSLTNRIIVAGGGGGTGGDRISCCGPGAGGGGGGGYYGGGGGGGYSGLPGAGGSQVVGGAGGLSPGCSIYGGLAGTGGILGFGGTGGGSPGNCQAGPNPGCQGGAGGAAIGATGVNCTSGGCPGTWAGGSGGGGSNYAGPCVAAITSTQGFQTGNGQIIITPICGGTPLAVTLTATNPTCGSCNGSIIANVTGGTSPYTYAWAPGGQTTQTISGLCAGSYTVSVEDATGCITVTASVTLTSTSIAVTANNTGNEPCNGNCVGSASTTIVGGVAPYTYAWTPSGGSNASATGLCAGTYTVTVHDHNGCTGTAIVTITQPALLTATLGVVNNVLCNGGTGSITISAGGGTTPYTYLWNPSAQTNATATGLSVGCYTVTVTDHDGCTATTSQCITQPTLLTASITAYTNVLCNGVNTGSETVTPSGGTAPYNYSWNPSAQTNATATGLSAGCYTVTVRDLNGCSATASQCITQPTLLAASVTAFTNILCNGGTNGSETVTATGGTTPYAYSWNPGGNTNANATGLSAGCYTVTVTDHNGCTATATHCITQPTLLTATIGAVTNVLCNGGTGSVAVNPIGGTSPYTYSWSPGGNTNANATGLSAGCYTVTVTDHDGCTVTVSQCITQPTLLTASVTAYTNVLCNGGTGTETVSAVGGTTPYTYSWTPSAQTNANATGLSVGCYTVTVKDHNGCSATASQCITQPTVLTASISAFTNVLCNGGTNGNETVTAAGGTTPYAYSWNPGGNSNANATGLSAGCYTVTVTDHNGCTASASHCITQPTPLAVTTTFTHASCNLYNGSATATPTGGSPAYAYSWSPIGGINALATGLSAGTYTVTVTDNNGCTASASVTVTQPSAVIATMGLPTNVLCNGGTGSATVSAAGGTAPYTYSWSPNGGTNATGTGLTAGTYTATVTDNNGCTSTASVTITEPALLTANMGAPSIISCNGGTASVTVTAGGGTLNYTYLWTPSAQTNATANGLSAGSYTVTVTDAHGCTATASITVTQPPLLTTSIVSHINVLCNGGTGSAIATVSGGSAPYIYTWSPSGGSSINAPSLSAGTYTFTVQDAYGCTATASVTITQPAVLTATMGAVTNVLCNGGTGSAIVNAAGGTTPYTYLWTPSAQTNANATGLSAGSYSVKVTDANGCTATASVTITEPAPLTATISSVTNVLCNGGTGGAIVTAAGGTLNYTYLWNPGGNTNANATGLPAGVYTVTVTDAHGCTASASATITEPALLTATMGVVNNVPCYGGVGNATVNATGGSPAYAYTWAPFGGNHSMGTGLLAGSYTVTVRDVNGCTATASVTISQPNALSVTATFTHAYCNLPNGTATALPTGGTPGYNYLWTPSAETNATATGLNAGSYTVTVTDANGCTASTPITVTQPSAVVASISGTTGVSCHGGANGTATASPAGGTAPYTYLWTPSANTNAYATGLYAGSYTVTITDNNGCTATTATTISEPTSLTTTLTGPTTVCQGSTGVFTTTATGGTLPYAYSWSNGATTSTASIIVLAAQPYSVIVTDANGCTATASINVNFGPPLSVSPIAPSSICTQGTAGFCVSAIGGTGGDTYSWTPGNMTTGCISVSPASTTIYTVVVTDNCGASASTTATVNVHILPDVDMNADVYTGCEPLCVQFRNASATSQSTAQYVWSFGNGDTIQSESPIYCYKNNGKYNVTLTITADSGGCSATLKKIGMITVYSRPAAAFTYSPQAISILTPTVQFTDQSKDQSNIVSWVWNFGDDNATSKVENPSYTYQDTGSFCASLTVMNAHGCTDTITNCLVIAPAFTLYIPSAFSPNGDGVNDVFQPVGKYIKSFEMYIFDRWGMQLYHTTDIAQGWKGNVNGGSNIAQEETYIYKIMVTDAQGVTHNYTGNVSIIK